MNIKILLLLCIIQAFCEFLPVSSSGHLLLVEKLFNIQNNVLLFNLFLHLATLFAVLIFYRKTIIKIIKQPFQPLTYKIIISSIFTVLFALAYELLNLSKILDTYLGFYFLLTAIILLLTSIFQKRAMVIPKNEISYKNAIIVGSVQGIAVLPGISRSGSTICSLVLLGNSEEISAEYSFLLSIPTIVGGFLFEIAKVKDWSVVFSEISPTLLSLSFLLTFALSLLSLKLTVKFLKKNKFVYFSIYLFVVGILTILFV